MVEELTNWELMGSVYKNEAESLREQLKQAENDKVVLVKKLLQAKPELKAWVEMNINEKR